MAINPGKARYLQFVTGWPKAKAPVISVVLLFLMCACIVLILALLALQVYPGVAVTAAILLVLLGLLAGLSYLYPDSYKWTGIAESNRVDNSRHRRRTLWDWLGLWIIPFIFTASAIGFAGFQNQANTNYNKSQSAIANTQQANDRIIAHMQEQQNVVQTYLDRMSDLLLNPNIRDKQGNDVRILAKARTLTILMDLDPDQKATIVNFLYYGDLIGQASSQTPYQPIVNLATADLTGINLSNISLQAANFQVANLSNAILVGTNLSSSYLPKVNLNYAHLQQAYLCYATFIGASTETSSLYHADLRNSHLTGANFTGADLRMANLSGANLSSSDTDPACPPGNHPKTANFTNAKLKGAILNGANLTGVIWDNTVCPDGRNSNDVGGSCMLHLKVNSST